MKTKIAFFALATLAALPSLAGDDVQITYRGQVRQVGTTTNTFATHTMSFRLYKEQGDVEAAWTNTVTDIPVDADGLFQVALRGKGLADAIDEGKANWLGVTILTGTDTNTPPQEQYPRQALLASPWAPKAARADAITDSPSIRTVSAGSVTAKSLATTQLSIGHGIRLPASVPVDATVHLEGDGWEGKTVPVKGEVHFFSRSEPTTLALQSYDVDSGCSFGVADCNCAVLFRESTAEATDYDRMPGMTLFFKKGETIALPPGLWLNDGDNAPAIEATVHPIGID